MAKCQKRRRQLIDLHSDDEDASDANSERLLSEEGHSSEGDSKQNPIADWYLGHAGVEILRTSEYSIYMKH